MDRAVPALPTVVKLVTTFACGLPILPSMDANHHEPFHPGETHGQQTLDFIALVSVTPVW